jgi:hypothetical protein
MDWQALQEEIAAWSTAKFGSEQDLDELVDHMIEELLELRRNKYDPENRADPLILLLVYNHFVGGTVEDLFQACKAKHDINVRERLWDLGKKEGRRWRKNPLPQPRQGS